MEQPFESKKESSLSSSTATPPPSTPSGGVETCYVFKSRLQEYAQKVGISTPVYQTIKEGPSHEPVFKSTVTVNDVNYDSLPGFFNRKAAEQSAAEVALIEIHKLGQMTESIPTVHESGLCKNLLQEYAQKMNYAIPAYKCSKQDESAHPFICTVEIGGIQYIGAAARTKKEAEIKAARTALLAIQYGSKNGVNGTSQYTVLPGKKKGREAADLLKPKKSKTKKNWQKRKFPRNKLNKAANIDNGETVDPGNSVEDASVTVDRDDITKEPLNPVNCVDDSAINSSRGDIMKEVPRTQFNEFSTSTSEPNGNHDGFTTLRSERVEESSRSKSD